MKQFIPAITLVTLLTLQAPVNAAWSSKGNPRSKQQTTDSTTHTPGFNLQDNRSWLVEADYLFWKPQMEDAYFALKSSTATGGGTTIATAKLKQPSFDLSSGVRVGIGGYSPDSWDVSLRGTYLYSDAQKKIHAHPSHGIVSVPEWFGSILGFDVIKAFDRWQMNFGLLDFTVGREFFLTKRFAAHPFIGLRAAIINQTNHINYSGFYNFTTQGTTTQVVGNTKLSTKSDIWGVGPRVGFDLNFYFLKGWSFLGGLAGSLLYTHYSVKEKFFNLALSGTSSALNTVNLNVKDTNNLGRANLDAYFGLGWNRWYNNGKNRIAIAFAFEAQQWFNLNQWFALDLLNSSDSGTGTNGLLNLRADKNHGDLSLIGGTVHFQFDF